jgi:replicative DNA helicase
MNIYTLEAGVIAGLLTHPKRIPEVLGILTPDDFITDAGHDLAKIIADRFAQNRTVNVFTVTEDVKKESGDLEEVLVKLMTNAPNGAETVTMAREIRELSARRKLKGALEDALNDERPTPVLMDELMTALHEIDYGVAAKRPASLKEALGRFRAWLDDKTPERVYRLGYSRLDGIVSGVRPGNLALIAARPAVGKSAFGADIALRLAKGGVKTIIFSCEMSEMEIVQRYVTHEAGIPLGDVMERTLASENRARVEDAIEAISPIPLMICDDAGITTQAIRRILQMTRDVGLIIVDYIQLMRSTGKPESRNLEVSKISGDLKSIAKEFDIPVIALSQLNRAKDETDEPSLTDLRDSGGLEQDADKVIFLWRIGEDADRKKIAVKVAKNRMGKTGYAVMYFDGAHMEFTETAEEYRPKRKGRGAKFEIVGDAGPRWWEET